MISVYSLDHDNRIDNKIENSVRLKLSDCQRFLVRFIRSLSHPNWVPDNLVIGCWRAQGLYNHNTIRYEILFSHDGEHEDDGGGSTGSELKQPKHRRFTGVDVVSGDT